MSDVEYPKVRRVILNICEACIKGEGQECHTPGCVLWLHKVDLPIGEEMLEDAEARDAEIQERCALYLDMLARNHPHLAEAYRHAAQNLRAQTAETLALLTPARSA